MMTTGFLPELHSDVSAKITQRPMISSSLEHHGEEDNSGKCPKQSQSTLHPQFPMAKHASRPFEGLLV